MTSTDRAESTFGRLSRWARMPILGAVTLVCVFFFASLRYLAQLWSAEEYSYAYIIPGVTSS